MYGSMFSDRLQQSRFFGGYAGRIQGRCVRTGSGGSSGVRAGRRLLGGYRAAAGDDWYGISDDMYEEYYGQTPMISANVDALVVVKAAEGKLTDVEDALDTYRESMVQDTFQYPINIPKIQASEIRTFGNYVCFVQLGADMDGMEDDDEAAIKACQEMNGRALSVIEKELTR